MNAEHQTISTASLSLGVNPRGLTFDSLVVSPAAASGSGSGSSRDVLVGFEDKEAYRERLFFGSTVGRYANRLPAGETQLSTGAKISLSGVDSVCLHGGEAGFDTLPWTRINRPDSSLFPLDDPEHPLPPLASDPHAPITEASAMFRLYSPAGSDGFPCTLETEALVVVSEPEKGDAPDSAVGTVKVVLRSRIMPDADPGIEQGTPVNLTVHWGFRLDDGLEPDILGHTLYIDSTELVSLDEKGLSTGSIDSIPQNGQDYDFYSNKQGRRIGESYPAVGIDRNFLLHPSPSEPPTPLSHEPQLVLTAPSKLEEGPRVRLSFKSSMPSVQIYSAPGLDGTGPAKKRAHSKVPLRQPGYDRDGALFIEFHQPVGTISHTCAIDAEPENPLKRWLETRCRELGIEEETKEGGDRSWERDSLLRRGQVWESWVQVEISLAP
ncbi:uncharacterized protein JCM15063_000117 [Sporobolomyces koalae]|uniref:uncharacterized protein n=1 Tax=Sporobolomyces koalae TaxID=500713 RepID=UPI00317D7A90